MADSTDPYVENLDELLVGCMTPHEIEDSIEIIADEVAHGDKSQPYVGMEFSTPEEAYTFYNDYAYRVGFSVRKSSKTKNRDGVSSVRFVCNKEGFSDSQKKKKKPIGSVNDQRTPEKEKGMTRTGCKASCRIRLYKSGVWRISVFEENHNHVVIKSPSKKRNLRSHKCLSEEDKKIIRNLSAQNMKPSQILEYLAVQYGGKQNIRFKKKDVSNEVSAENRSLLGVDVDTTLCYFQKKKEKDPEFFYAIDLDENGAVKNIFWVDGRGRRSYQEFGDVVTFDTTYQTNIYSMPLAPFLGVSHHRHTISFGWALLRLEDAPNFCWLFKTWLEAMYGKHPSAIITDQDPAMKKAIVLIFPKTKHRCCQWHVMRKARDHLGLLYSQMEGFKEELQAVINRSLTVVAFERDWEAMLVKFKLTDNSHLKLMFSTRTQWVPAYFRDTFFANMSTTQRSESMNAILKLWVDSHKSIYQFVKQIEKLTDGIWQRESDEDLKSMNEQPHLYSPYQMEIEARMVYTRNVFSVFKDIVRESFLGFVTEIIKDKLYHVRISFNPQFRNFKPESYEIEVDIETSRVSCTCKGFEVEGLICPHSIKVMHHIGMAHLPAHYILTRWTKGANANSKKHLSERSMDTGQTIELQALRFATIKSSLMEMGKVGALSVETFNCLKQIIIDGMAKLMTMEDAKLMSMGQTIVTVDPPEDGTKEVSSKPLYIDPPDAQCKGKRKKLTRFQPPADKKERKMRTCSICNAKKRPQC
uniref:SWIM-type domain-containing protein n=1 Tax=Oryza brachyantha TaxID=4533 RepID=J3KXX0_ORYBR